MAVTDERSEFRDQSLYLNEQILLLDEKLALNVGFRADRSSANGDREKFYLFPKYSGSYRFVKPFSDKIDEFKVRGAWGQSGNRPRYADRDMLYASPGQIGGQGTLTSSSVVGNPAIKPEIMNELEFGFDASFFGSRVGLEATRYQRTITDLLLTYPLAPSSGLTNKVINGGQLSVLGTEGVLSLVPMRRGGFEWTSRIIYNTSKQYTNSLPVPDFNVGGSFGSAYGRNRIVSNSISTKVWSNAPLRWNAATKAYAVVDTITGDANPIHTTTFSNDFTWKRLTASVLLDWRAGGTVSNMTNNLWDEGGNARDYDAVAPTQMVAPSGSGNPGDPNYIPGSMLCGNRTLGDCRYETFNANDTRVYMQNGTYVKVREITLSYSAPDAWAQRVKAKSLRFNLSGRNLYMFSDYWGFDPEFNNFGNQNFNRFIDLAPFPSSRQFFLSIDLGF